MAASTTKAQLNTIVASMMDLHTQETQAITAKKPQRHPDAVKNAFARAVKEAYELGHAEKKEGVEKSDMSIEPDPPTAPEGAPQKPHVNGVPQ